MSECAKISIKKDSLNFYMRSPDFEIMAAS